MNGSYQCWFDIRPVKAGTYTLKLEPSGWDDPVKYEIKDSSFILREQILFVPFQKDESYPMKQKGDFLYIGDTEWVKD